MKTFTGSVLLLAITLLVSFTLKAQAPQIRVACVGNSITQGFGTSDPRSYPQQLGKLLGSHYDVRNFGVGGRTLLNKGDFPYMRETAFYDALDFDPQIVIIKLGTNDSKPQNWVYKDEFYKDYMQLIGEFRKLGRHPQIYVCSPCPVTQDNFGIRNAVIRDEIIPICDSVRRDAGCYLIDFYGLMPKDNNMYQDGVHPTEAGYALMGQIAYNAVVNSPSGLTRYFYANKATYEKDESVTLYWETTKGSQVTINGSKVNEADSMVVKPTGSSAFTLIAKGTVTDTVKLNIQYLAPGKVKTFNVFPPSLDKGLGDTTTISWTATNGSLVTFNGTPVETNGSKKVWPKETTKYTLIAKGDKVDTSYITVQVLDSDKINRALFRNATSSLGTRGYSPSATVDGDPNTFWMSTTNTSVWVSVALGRTYNVNRVVINWGNVYGKTYSLQSLNDAGQTLVLYTNKAGDGGIDDLTGLNGESKQLRLLVTVKSNTDSAVVIKEIEIYGVPKTTTDVKECSFIPESFTLEQNYPNPFNPSTKIAYSIPTEGMVTLKVYDMLGREVTTLINKIQQQGSYKVNFDASALSGGVYFYKMIFGSIVETKKLLLLK